jgi:hypothetical protein
MALHSLAMPCISDGRAGGLLTYYIEPVTGSHNFFPRGIPSHHSSFLLRLQRHQEGGRLDEGFLG